MSVPSKCPEILRSGVGESRSSVASMTAGRAEAGDSREGRSSGWFFCACPSSWEQAGLGARRRGHSGRSARRRHRRGARVRTSDGSTELERRIVHPDRRQGLKWVDGDVHPTLRGLHAALRGQSARWFRPRYQHHITSSCGHRDRARPGSLSTRISQMNPALRFISVLASHRSPTPHRSALPSPASGLPAPARLILMGHRRSRRCRRPDRGGDAQSR